MIEFKRILAAFTLAQQQGIASVLATVVHLQGSSYRRPGVRMLILKNGQTFGAVSGGCVEKEVVRQAASVLETGVPKIMTYDGRYRLGCEGILHILIEPFQLEKSELTILQEHINQRKAITIECHFDLDEESNPNYGSWLQYGSHSLSFRALQEQPKTLSKTFEQNLQACQRLLIFGAEHDSVILCQMATTLGWQVDIIADIRDQKSITDFPNAHALFEFDGNGLELGIDQQTAIMVMSHSYAKDLAFIRTLHNEKPQYLGLLGPQKRRSKLIHELLEIEPEISLDLLDSIKGPAGLHIGAETPQEIAVSIIAEILSVINQVTPIPLHEKEGKIHAS